MILLPEGGFLARKAGQGTGGEVMEAQSPLCCRVSTSHHAEGWLVGLYSSGELTDLELGLCHE